MWRELIAALVLTAVSVLVHALGTYAMLLGLLRATKKHRLQNFTRALLTMLGFVGSLLILHSIEVVIWAQFYLWKQCFPSRETSYYFSLMSYSTVGYGDVVISHPWRLMGGLEAMTGVLLFGWSTACLVAFIYYVQDATIKKLGPTSN
jgi:hypothetical protein